MFNGGESERWSAQAFDTLKSARQDLLAKSYNWCCFKAQQAAECSVKGLLRGFGISAHENSIVELLNDLRTDDLDINDLLLCAGILDRHYTQARYPDAFPKGSPFEFYDNKIALEALGCAERICNFCDAKGKEYETNSRVC